MGISNLSTKGEGVTKKRKEDEIKKRGMRQTFKRKKRRTEKVVVVSREVSQVKKPKKDGETSAKRNKKEGKREVQPKRNGKSMITQPLVGKVGKS